MQQSHLNGGTVRSGPNLVGVHAITPLRCAGLRYLTSNRGSEPDILLTTPRERLTISSPNTPPLGVRILYLRTEPSGDLEHFSPVCSRPSASSRSALPSPLAHEAHRRAVGRT